ncbi:membrane-spanning protein [Bacillus sp. 37MA]|uniref:membrane-spanning protein n=1 Tax=Bacillus sp. 37MA TaxID=1132442 RepID=UPI00039D13CA|nr:membrane-spanning protein [Bacillus sp. 37MA]
MLNGNFSTWPAALGRILCGAVPLSLLFFKKTPFNLPLIISYYLLLFCTLFLGATLKFYDRFPWWDTMLHFFGAAFSGFNGIAIYNFLLPNGLQKGVSRWMIFLFVLSFSVMISVLWESAEFTGAVIGALKEDSNKDTMTDLIMGLVGAVVVAIYAVLRKNLTKTK